MDLRDQRILITGASGALGSQLIYELTNRDIKPVCHVRESSDTGYIDSLGLEKRLADLRDRPSLKEVMRDIDAVIHTAAYVDFRKDKLTQFTGANTIGAVEMYRAAASSGVKRFVHVSSIAAVGGRKRNGNDQVIKQSGWIRSKNGHIDETFEFNLDDLKIPYFMTKHAAEIELLKESASGGPELVIVNPSIILAPSSRLTDRERVQRFFDHWFVPSFANMMNLVDIRDVAPGVLGALERGRPGERYLLTGDNISARDLVLTISAVLKKAPQLIGLRRWFLDLSARASVSWRTLTGKSRISFYPDLVRLLDYDWIYTARKARHELGFNPRPLVETLEDLLIGSFSGSPVKQQ